MHFSASSILVAAAFAPSVAAHMLMSTPVIMGTGIQNGPLAPDGSDFPCKFGSSGYDTSGTSTENTYTIGTADNELAFTGSAVHGGGSCQISLTYDRPPTKSSVWKVITSIEGGCPARNTEGNFDANSATYVDPYTYNFTIPDGLEAGQYTLAWTWFNKLGNREMYMNCAQVTLEGSGGSQDTYDALPDMFVANIDNGGCSTPNALDLVFPDPGENLFSLNGATTATGSFVGACSTGVGSGYPTGSATAATSTSTSAAKTTAKATATASTGGQFVETPTAKSTSFSSTATVTSKVIATTSITTSKATATAVSSTTPKASSTTTKAASQSSVSVASTGAETVGSACTNEGAWNCIDGSSYQRCASGQWSAVMQMASGMSCASGVSSTLSYSATNSRVKRALRIGAKMLKL